MITPDQYTLLTGAPAPANFAALRGMTVARIEAAIDCQLTEGERTESLEAFGDGWVYPAAMPVIDCADAVSFDWDRINMGGPGRHTVNYIAGFSAFEGEGIRPCPIQLAMAIAWAIHTVRNPQPSELPAGVTSMAVAGEFSVTRDSGVAFGADGEKLPGPWAAPIADLGGRCATLVAGYRRVR